MSGLPVIQEQSGSGRSAGTVTDWAGRWSLVLSSSGPHRDMITFIP